MSTFNSSEKYSILDETFTPISYKDRVTVEFALNGTSWILNVFLFLFVRFRKGIWNSLKSTIAFVTTGSLLLNLPLLSFQFWMVINLQFDHQPTYSILICSFLKNVCSSTTSAYQILPFAVSIYRYRTVVQKQHPTHFFVIYVHSIVTSIFILFAFLNYPFGTYLNNDVCNTLRFSNVLELVRIFSTLFFNFSAIFMNIVILRFVMSFKKESAHLQNKQMQLTQSLLLQSIVPVLVSLPLLLGSFEFYFGIQMPQSFASTWYAITFLGPFLVPLSSIMGMKSTRQQLINDMCCHRSKIWKTQTISIIISAKVERSVFTIRDDE